MLWSIAASLLIVGRVLGQQTCIAGRGLTQSGDNNYVIDSFSGLWFTYAINRCTGVSLTDDSTFVKYTCSQQGADWWVTKSSYSTNTCSGSPALTETWNATGTSPGQPGYFKCDGADNYAQIQISIDSECGASIDVYGGLGSCAQNPSVLDTKFFCNATSAFVQLYVNPESNNLTINMCNDTYLFCNRWNFRADGCHLSAVFNSIPVYGKMITCVTDGTTTTSAATTTGGATTTTGSGTTTTDGTGTTTTGGTGTTTTGGTGTTTTGGTGTTTTGGTGTTTTAGTGTTTTTAGATTTAGGTTTTDDTDTTSSAKSFSVLSAIVALVALFY